MFEERERKEKIPSESKGIENLEKNIWLKIWSIMWNIL